VALTGDVFSTLVMISECMMPCHHTDSDDDGNYYFYYYYYDLSKYR